MNAIKTLLVDDDHMEIPIARLTIEPSSTDIPQTKIENLVGTTACPIASGILEQVTTDNLVAQWDAQFNTWFNNLVSELDTNQATNLQNQINDIGDRLSMLGRNILINGDMQVSQRGDGPYLMSGNYYTYSLLGPDLWRPGLTDSGSWNFGTVDYIHNGVTKKWLRLDCAVAKTTLTAASSFWVHQRIEGYRVEAARFGDPANAKPLTLSFLFRASKSGTYVVELLQIGATENTTVSRSFVYTTPGAIQKVTLTYPPNTITALTRPWNEENLRVGFYVSAGSNLTSSALNDSWIGSNAGVTGRATGQVNLADTVNAYAMWTDIQLEIGSDTIYLVEDTLVVQATDGFDDYYWSDGTITNTLTLVRSDLDPGYTLFTLIVIDEYGCSQTDTVWVYSDRSAVEDLNAYVDCQVYPNPGKENLQIQFKGMQSLLSTVSFFDATGQLKKEVSYANGTKISTSDLPSGLYVLKISTGTEYFLKKWIKE